MIGTEVWLGIIGIAATIFGAWAYQAKRSADAKLTTANTELAEVENEGKRFDQLMLLINSMGVNLQRQIEVNQSFILSLQQTQQVDEQNYQTLKGMWDRHAAEIMTSTRDSRDKVLGAVNALPLKLAEINRPLNAQVMELLTQVVKWSNDSREGQATLVDKVSKLEERLDNKDKRLASLEEDNRQLEAKLSQMMAGVKDDDLQEAQATEGTDDSKRHSGVDLSSSSDGEV